MSESQPLFVRLPRAAAERLEEAAAQAGTSKREIITKLVTGDDLVVGQHSFRPADAPAVLTVEETAELLRTEPPVVLELAEAGELPGRRVGDEWRFARAAVLAWLGA
jgi:excisionase family DNA binding protein